MLKIIGSESETLPSPMTLTNGSVKMTSPETRLISKFLLLKSVKSVSKPWIWRETMVFLYRYGCYIDDIY